LLGAAWLGQRRIVMLEPRRLAARSIARRLAMLLGEDVGEVIGYRMRGDSRVGASTRIEVVTEGVLTRMLLRDPALDAYGAVIFDEFHERSIHADMGLALTLQSQEVLRPDLRILVMSATIDGARVSSMLGDAPMIVSPDRNFPVDVRYVGRREGVRVEGAAAAAVQRALVTDEGSILAFLPGAGEIKQCASLLERANLPSDVRVAPLYGDLTLDAQDAAIRRTHARERKVVLATSIAETSLTIEGVRIVIDGGLARTSRFSPRSGMSRLETTRVSLASADQRAGRAGRDAPGVCIRLWTEGEHAALLDRARPEILEADLAPLALDLAVAGVTDVNDLRWMDVPPATSLEHARDLLRRIGAVDDAHRITTHGRHISSLGLHPRLAHMLLRSQPLGCVATACVAAALLEERDILRNQTGERDPDLSRRFSLVTADEGNVPHQIRARVRALRSLMNVPRDELPDDVFLGHVVALAYPERVAQRRGAADRFRLRNGVGAVLPAAGGLSSQEFLAIAELDGRSPNATIYLAASLEREVILSLFGAEILVEDAIEWRSTDGLLVAVRRERLDALVLREVIISDVDADRAAKVLATAIRERDGIELRWTPSADQLRRRVAFMRSRDDRWPDWSDAALLDTLDLWLVPHLVGLRRRSDMEQLPLQDFLLDSLAWEQRRDLDRFAPTHVVVPTGSRIAVDYTTPESPRIAVRLQELFGLERSPMIGDGSVPLTIELLSPAYRPVQVTRDLAGFWRNSYFDVRKELRGRYPRHEWPEDPLSAAPTRRAKPRS
jgi:ATP-dependent helicase HrpB